MRNTGSSNLMKHRRGIRVGILILIMNGTLCAASQLDQKILDKVVVEEPVVNAGKVLAGKKIRSTFGIINLSNQSITIKKVKAGCSCTSVIHYPKHIQPNKKAELIIELDTAELRGKISRSIQIFFDGKLEPTQTWVKAEVIRRYGVSPRGVYFGRIRLRDTLESKPLRITSELNEPLEIIETQLDSPLFDVSEVKTNNAMRADFKIKLKPSKKNRGMQNEHLTIIFKLGTDQPEQIQVPIYAFVTPKITIYPQQVELQEKFIQSGGEQRIYLSLNDPGDLKITTIQAPPQVQYKLVTQKAKESYQIHTIFPKHWDMANPQNSLSVKYTVAGQPNHQTILIKKMENAYQ